MTPILKTRVSEWNNGKAFRQRLMHRLSTIALVEMLAVTMAGCGSQPSSEQSISPTPSTPQVVKNTTTAKPFDNPPPTITQQPQKIVVTSASGLIPPTNSNERTKQVPTGRSDPFAALFKPLVPKVPTPNRQTTVPQLPRPPVAVPQTVAKRTNSPSQSVVPRTSSVTQPPPALVARGPLNSNIGNVGSQFAPGRGNLLPPVVPGSSSQPVLPPPPQQPDLANSVAVSGVIQVGSEYQAIVQVPNEATSRYVRVGQRLSNGQVLVKRIEINQGSDPVVILEQYGIEVARAVGEEPVKPAQPGTTTNTSPATPPPPPNNTTSPEG